MKLQYNRPTIEEYMELCQEEKECERFAKRLERCGEFEEAKSMKMELRFIEIKKTCYKAALKLDQKRKAATVGTVKTA